MKKKLRELIVAGLVGLLIGLGVSLVSIRGQERPSDREDRFREWQERRREAADADARVALEARQVKLEVDLANYNRRLDWMEKVLWGAIVGILAILGREVLSVYLCSFGEPACVREKSVNGLMNSPKNPGEALLLDQCSPTGGETSGD